MSIADKAKKAKSVAELTNVWFGASPQDLDDRFITEKCEAIPIEDTFGSQLTIFGYQEKAGDKGKFAVILCTTDKNPESPFVVVTGGQVVLKKLEIIRENNDFPVKGQFVHPDGKKYFDLI